MHLISKKPLKEYWAEHPDAEDPLKAWIAEVETARWANPAEMKSRYPSASLVGPCTVFNIGGNKHRLVVWINYVTGRVFVRKIGTHEEYDEWKVETL